jgi:signal transduction histidine kinase
VVINLIGNAIKFTKEKGTIIVSVKAHTNDLVEISVIDDGYGISKDN